MSATSPKNSLPACETTPKGSSASFCNPGDTMTSKVLTQFMAELVSGQIKIVDLTETLTPEFPTIVLPPEFGQAWPFRLEEISRYDERGPAWHWNNFSCSEHTGTHFDAPAHWVSGKDQPDNTVDRIPIEAFIASACVIDCSAQARDNPDFLLTIDGVRAWEAAHGRIPARSWVLMRTDWSKRAKPVDYLNMRDDGAHSPGHEADVVPCMIRERDRNGSRMETV